MPWFTLGEQGTEGEVRNWKICPLSFLVPSDGDDFILYVNKLHLREKRVGN